MSEEDTHFYIDNAPPEEVSFVLRFLSSDSLRSSDEISGALEASYDFSMQRDKNYSPRRLFDLGLTKRIREGSSIKYQLTDLGSKLQMLLSTDQALGFDLLHYMHYVGFLQSSEDRKLLWTYKRCCNHVWESKSKLDSKKLASQIQSEIVQEFPHLQHLVTEQKGMRIDARGVGEVIRWLRAMEPSPLDEDDKVQPRQVANFQLPLLALDYVYRDKGFAYGSAVVLTDDILDAVARVFFLDKTNCRDLLTMAARFSSVVKFSDTLAGASVSLTRPYSLTDL